MSDELTNTFQQRRQLAIAVAELANAETMPDLADAARDIYDAYPNVLIQAELVKNLDTPDSQLRGGLGLLATHLPDDQIRNALRMVAADRSQSAQRRLTAAMIASKYLGQPIPAALLSDLSQGNEVAFQSLLEAVEEGKRNRHVLLEYVLQMRDAGDHVPPLVLDLLERLPAADRVELLRLIALDDRENVAISALGRLELIASSDSDDDASASALRALHVLQFMLPAEIVDLTEDALRRLRFRGKVYRPPQPTGWRALISLPQFNGTHTDWLVHMPSDNVGEAKNHGDVQGELLQVVVDAHTGAFQADHADGLDAGEMPPQTPIGQILFLASGAEHTPPYLEVPFDFARWLLLRATPGHWKVHGTLHPEYRLHGDRIWEYARPDIPPEIASYFSESEESELSASWVTPDAALSQPEYGDAMKIWLLYNQLSTLFVGDLPVPESPEQRASLAKSFADSYDQVPYASHIREAMPDVLRTQAAWFHLAGYPGAAHLAQSFAHTVPDVPLSKNPLLFAILYAALDAAAENAVEGEMPNESMDLDA